MSKERINLSHIPDSFRLKKVEGSKVHFGGEAVVMETLSESGHLVAFKWYDKHKNKSKEELLNYAENVNRDEEQYKEVGLGTNVVYDTHFVIAEGKNFKPQLYAMQPWIKGRLLKNVSIFEIIKNRNLRSNLSELYLRSAAIYWEHRELPDLSGGEKWVIGGKTIPDLRKVIWPFWTSNIMVVGDKAILHDARTHSTKPGSLKYDMILFHRRLTMLAGYLLKRLPF